MDYFALAGVAAELREALIGARVQRVHQPAPADLVLACHGPDGAHRLLISVDPAAPRVHLTRQRRANPTVPPGFCQVARKDLEGADLVSVEMPHRDRVVRLVFNDADGAKRTLVVELMGRNGNVFLLDPSGRVRGQLRAIPAASARPLRPGRVYTDPPGISTTPAGFGRFADGEIAARGEAGRDDLLERVDASDFDPHVVLGDDGRPVGAWAFVPLTVPPERRHPCDSLSEALDALGAETAERRGAEGARAALMRRIEREMAHRRGVVEGARRTLREAERADEHEADGNLLLAHLSAVPGGAREVDLPDWSGDAVRTVWLDPTKSPSANAEACFERARKARDAAEYAEGRLADAQDELGRIEALRVRLDDAPDPAVDALSKELDTFAPRKEPSNAGAAAPSPFGGHKIRTYDLSGWTLLVGETATANDHLLTRVAAPTDIWMHVRGGTGAHGVLRVPKGATVPDPILRRAAAVVAARSGSVKHSSLVAVDVTPRKYVRKPRGAKPGLALYTQARTVDVVPALPGDDSGDI
ncbi:MAG: NFACT family protein [Armatimonadota bacterium]